MNKYLQITVCICLCICFSTIKSQNLLPTFDYAYAFGNEEDDGIKDFVIGLDSNIYATGFFAYDSVDFDPFPNSSFRLSTNLPNSSAGSFFFAKYTTKGRLRWVKKFEGTNSTEGLKVLVDVNGDLIVLGHTNFSPGVLDLNPDPNATFNRTFDHAHDVFFIRFDSLGTFRNAGHISSPGYIFLADAQIDHNSNLYITGGFQDTVDFNPDISQEYIINQDRASHSAFLLKLDSNFNFKWVHHYNKNYYGPNFKLDIDSQNRILIAGKYTSGMDLNPDTNKVDSLTIPNGGYSFISKISPSGTLVWAKAFSGLPNTSINFELTSGDSIAFVQNVNNYLNIYPDSISISLGPQAAYLIRLSDSGSFVNSKLLANQVIGTFHSMEKDSKDNILVTTKAQNISFFRIDPNGLNKPINRNGYNNNSLIYFSIDDQNTFLWAFQIICATFSSEAILKEDLQGGYIHAGAFSESSPDTVDFDPSSQVFTLNVHPNTSLAVPTTDIFLARLDTSKLACASISIDTVSIRCSQFVWQHNNQLYTQSGTYTDTVANRYGCDSVLTLILNLNPDIHIDSITSIDSLFWIKNGVTYYQSGFYSDTLINQFGCDSIIGLDLIIMSAQSARIRAYFDKDSVNISNCEEFTHQKLVIKNLGTQERLRWRYKRKNAPRYFENFEDGYDSTIWQGFNHTYIADTCGVLFGKASHRFYGTNSYLETKPLNTVNVDSIYFSFKKSTECDTLIPGTSLDIFSKRQGQSSYGNTMYTDRHITHFDSIIHVAIALPSWRQHPDVMFLIRTNKSSNIYLDNFRVGGQSIPDGKILLDLSIDTGQVAPLDSQIIDARIDRKWIVGGIQDYGIEILSNDSISPTHNTNINLNLDQRPCPSFDYVRDDCDINILFTNKSQGIGISSKWEFGDNSSTFEYDPIHQYSTPSIYSVKLRSCNRFGCDSIVQQINSNLYQNSKALCNINTNRSIDGRGVTFVSLNQINNSSGMSIYRYFQCPEARLSSHKPDTLRITTSVNSDVWAMIDFNSNGVIDTNEIVMTSVNKINHQSIVNIPSTAIKGIPLRMRVASFYPNSNLNNVACLNYNRMQYEEYNIIITDSTVSPIARFNSTIIDNCNRIIQFRDTSYNSPLSWQWDFGDNTNSTLQHPTHSYHTAGTYQVKLITSNITGSDTITRQLFVPVGQTIDSIIASSCSTYLTPSGKTLTTSGIYLDTLTSSMSCDSIFHIDLQISLIDTTLFQSGLMIRSNEPNAQYQWLDCSNGYNQIVGETLDSIVVLQNGIYGVEITKGACVDTSVCLNVTWVGIEEDNSDQLLELYPIPATDKLFIRLHQPLAKNESIELLNIYSLSGKEIATYKSFSAKEIILDVSRFPKGVYVIKLKVDQRLFVRKFIIS